MGYLKKIFFGIYLSFCINLLLFTTTRQNKSYAKKTINFIKNHSLSISSFIAGLVIILIYFKKKEPFDINLSNGLVTKIDVIQSIHSDTNEATIQLPVEIWVRILKNYFRKNAKIKMYFVCKGFFSILYDTNMNRKIMIKKELEEKFISPKIRHTFTSLYDPLTEYCNKNQSRFQEDKQFSYWFLKYFINDYLLYNPNLQITNEGNKANCAPISKIITLIKNTFFSKNPILTISLNLSLEFTILKNTDSNPILFQLDIIKKDQKKSRLLFYYISCSISNSNNYNEDLLDYTDFSQVKDVSIAILMHMSCKKQAGHYCNSIKPIESIANLIKQLNITSIAPTDSGIFNINNYPKLEKLFLNSYMMIETIIKSKDEKKFELIHNRYTKEVEETIKNLNEFSNTKELIEYMTKNYEKQITNLEKTKHLNAIIRQCPIELIYNKTIEIKNNDFQNFANKAVVITTPFSESLFKKITINKE